MSLDFLHMQMDSLSELVQSMPFILDRSQNQSYSSLSSRLQSMHSSGEFAGFLEIIALCYIIERPIHILQKDDDDLFKFIAKLPTVSTIKGDQRPILLLHQFDTQQCFVIVYNRPTIRNLTSFLKCLHCYVYCFGGTV
jgi:hypothetical protein